jgi:acyl carrier protein
MADSISKDEVASIVDRVLQEEFEVPSEQLLPDAALFTDLELDSLDIVDLIVALEKAFGMKIRTDATQAFRDVRTLGDLHNVIFAMRGDGSDVE